MRISLNWLNNYINVDFSETKLRDRLTMVGFEVEEVEKIKPAFSGIVIGEVRNVTKHPNSDKLKCCEVDVGNKVLTMVCGAPNVQEDLLVPVAQVGSLLDGSTSIKSVSIRGVQSHGMICSEKELGLSDDHSGIMTLDKEKFTVGELLFPSFQSEDTIFVMNITPNRPDCLSVLGIAREIGVMSGQTIKAGDDSVKESKSPIKDLMTINVEEKGGCPRYSARVIQNVQVGPSPDWIKRYLQNVGLRSINNVVDITNYILMETGQPLHAFDYDLITKQKIVVRKAKEGEKFTTLDNTEHLLTNHDLLICDGEKGVALAGIMGGINSEVTDVTKNILLESAHFDPMTIRKTAKRLGIITEASQRFERGVDPNMTIHALNRATHLISELGGGTVAKGISDIYPRTILPWKITLRHARIKTVLGIDIPSDHIIRILEGLGLKVEGTITYQVTIPTYRPDLKEEIDLIEEVARHYGYDKIDAKLTSQLSLEFIENPELDFTEKIRTCFSGIGFYEITTNSLVSRDQNENIFKKRKSIGIQNPLSPETAFLRTSLIPGLLNTIQWNRNRSMSHLYLFEIGRVFSMDSKTVHCEKSHIAGALSGPVRSKPFWGEKEIHTNFFHLKGILESFLDKFHVPHIQFIREEYDPFEQDRSLTIYSGKQRFCIMGEIKQSIKEFWEIDNPVFIFEINIVDLLKTIPCSAQYQPVPRFPALKRDLAILINDNISAETIKETIHQTAGKNCQAIELFDLYRGRPVPEGKKSIAFSLTFLSNERTLKEEEIDPIINSIIETLETKFSAKLRF